MHVLEWADETGRETLRSIANDGFADQSVGNVSDGEIGLDLITIAGDDTLSNGLWVLQSDPVGRSLDVGYRIDSVTAWHHIVTDWELANPVCECGECGECEI